MANWYDRKSGSFVRADIQFLRGIAVLAVVLYHAKLLPTRGGYLGVDMFFVISGFLITGNILRALANGRFTFSDFYLRRAFRLLPAAYCTVVLCTLGALLIVPSAQWSDYSKQVAGAVTFTANFVLPMQAGYFETAAELKPLLHTWSLSIEEQYYLVLPLLLVLVRTRWHGAMLALLALASLALCAVMVQAAFVYWRLPEVDSRQAAFYLLPARAWQLLVGSLLAWATLQGRAPVPATWVKRAAVCIVLLLFAFPTDNVHPRTDAVIVTLATAMALAGTGRWLPSGTLTRAVVRVGDWSYSLYLVHWPILVFVKLAYLGDVPWLARTFAALLALGLAALQYRFVEQKFRYGWSGHRHRSMGWIGAISIFVLVLPVAIGSLRAGAPGSDLDYLSEPNHGLSAACAQAGALTDPASCSTRPMPRFALWGDSYAMHLVPGLLKVPAIEHGGLVQVTKAACAPILGMASIDQNHDARWAARCLAYNKKAFDMLAANPSVTHVLMSSPLQGYFSEGSLEVFVSGQPKVAQRELAINAMVSTVQSLQAAGKRPVLIAPPPSPGFDIGQCHLRRAAGLLVFGRDSCDFDLEERRIFQAGIREGLVEVALRTGAPLLGFESVVCPNGRCRTQTSSGTVVYKDRGHLSTRGSQEVVPRLQFGSSLGDALQGAGAPSR